MSKVSVISIRHEGIIYVQCDQHANIANYSSRIHACRAWEQAYEAALEDEDMVEVALIHSILFDIVGHDVDHDWLRGNVIKVPCDVVELAEEAGLHGIICTGPKAKEWHFLGARLEIKEPVGVGE